MLKPNTSPKNTRIELSNDTFAERKFVKFSHTNRKHFTVGDPMAFPIVKMENKTPKTSLFPRTTLTPSNTAMPRPTARTTPNRSSYGWGTVAHVRRNVPVGYNGAPLIRPQKYPFPWTDPQTPPPASFLDLSDLWCQTASGSDPPFFHNAMNRSTYGQTDRSSTGKFDDYSPLRLQRERRGLIITRLLFTQRQTTRECLQYLVMLVWPVLLL